MPFGIMNEHLKQIADVMHNIEKGVGSERNPCLYFPGTPSSGITLTSGPTDVRGPWQTFIGSGAIGYDFQVTSVYAESMSSGTTILLEIDHGGESCEVMGNVREYDKQVHWDHYGGFDNPIIDKNSQVRARLVSGSGVIGVDVWLQYRRRE